MIPIMESMDSKKLKSPVQVSKESRVFAELGFSVQESDPYFNLRKSSAFNRAATMKEDAGMEEIQKAVSAETKAEQKVAEWVARCPIEDSGGQEILKEDAPNTGLSDHPKDTFQKSRPSGRCSTRRKRRKKRSVKKSMVSDPLCSPSRIPGLLQAILTKGLMLLPFIVFMVFMLRPVESTSQTSRYPRDPHSLTSAPFHKYIFCDDSLNLTNENLFIHIHLTEICNVMADGSHAPKKCKKTGVTVNQVNDSCLLMQTMDTVEKLYFMNVGEKPKHITSKPAGQFSRDVPESSDSYRMNDTASGDQMRFLNQSEPGTESPKCCRSLWRLLVILCSFVILLTIILYVRVLRKPCKHVKLDKGNVPSSVEESEPSPAVLFPKTPSMALEEGLLVDNEHNGINGIKLPECYGDTSDPTRSVASIETYEFIAEI